MRAFTATYFDGHSSRAHPVTVSWDGIGSLLVTDAAGAPVVQVPLRDCTIEPALGGGPRSLHLPGDGKLETADHEAVADLERRQGDGRVLGRLHRAEQRWPMVVLALLGIVLVGWGGVRFGIPAVAERVARSVPPAALQAVTERALQVLDAQVWRPSALDPERQAALRRVFRETAADLDPPVLPRLEYRAGGPLGPNAFAFPAGVVVVTDELVALAEDDLQLAGVFAHELAHVTARHGLRSVLQDTGVALLISLVVGDVTSITSLASALPTLLVESGYARRFEREADVAAGCYLLERGVGVEPYVQTLEAIARAAPAGARGSLFSSHPDSADRIAALHRLERSGACP